MRKTDTRTFAGLACGLVLAIVGPFLAAVGGESGVGDDSGVGYESGVGDESGVTAQSGVEIVRAETYAAATRGADGYWYGDDEDRFMGVYATAYRSTGAGSENRVPGDLRERDGLPRGVQNQSEDGVFVFFWTCEIPPDEEAGKEDHYDCEEQEWHGSADGFEQRRTLKTASYQGVLTDGEGNECSFDITWEGGKLHAGAFTFGGGYADGGRRSAGGFAEAFASDQNLSTWSYTDAGGGWRPGDAGAGAFTGAALWRDAKATIDAPCLPSLEPEFGAIWADAVGGGFASR